MAWYSVAAKQATMGLKFPSIHTIFFFLYNFSSVFQFFHHIEDLNLFVCLFVCNLCTVCDLRPKEFKIE